MPLDCKSPDYGVLRWAAQPLLQASQLRKSVWHAGAAELPGNVDHRGDNEEGPMRNQGEVGACTAFSLAGAIDHSVALRTGHPGSSSAMHLWARYHEPSMARAEESNLEQPITSEAEWPYTSFSAKQACSWVGCDRTARCRTTPCGRPVDTAALRAADLRPRFRMTNATLIHQHAWGKADRTTLLDVLAKGQDLWIAMGISADAFDSDSLRPQWDGLNSVVPDFDDEPYAHAMTVVGYAARPSGIYFLLRNSWGSTWGDGGYAWIHEETLLSHLHHAYVIEAQPWTLAAGETPSQQIPYGACPNGLLPDSTTAQCVPPCPDGSSRHNGACADPTDCPDGYVNLEGACAVAAPVTSGVDPASGIGFQCQAAGCVFRIPFGAYCPSFTGCMASCASPRYRLAFRANGLACTE